MKKIIAIALIFSGCTTKPICIDRMYYNPQDRLMAPGVVHIKLNNIDDKMLQKIASGKLNEVLLYAVNKDDWHDFKKDIKFTKRPGSVTLSVITHTFKSDFRPRLTQQQIDETIKGDVGLVFGKDTIRVQECKECALIN